MLGKIDINKVDSVIKPLRALNNVLSDSKNCVHVVYEFTDDKVFIGARNSSGDTFGMYELDVNEVFEGYENPNTEIGVYYVPELIQRLGLFDRAFTIDFDGKNVLNIHNDTDDVTLYTTDVSQIKKGKRNLNTSKLELGSKFKLDIVNKLKTAVSSYATQDIIKFTGDEDNGTIKISIETKDTKNSDSYSTVLEGVDVEKDFEVSFSKEQLNKVFTCNPEFDVQLFAGDRNIIEFSYAEDDYSMKFYVSPVTN